MSALEYFPRIARYSRSIYDGAAMPPKPARAKQINLRITAEEEKRFRELAESAGMSLAGWCRVQLRRAAEMPTA